MCPNIPKDNGNFFHKLFQKFTIGFIVFINQFNPRKEITFIKEKGRTIIFNTIPNSLNKRTLFKNMINIVTTLIAHMISVCNFYPSRNLKS